MNKVGHKACHENNSIFRSYYKETWTILISNIFSILSILFDKSEVNLHCTSAVGLVLVLETILYFWYGLSGKKVQIVPPAPRRFLLFILVTGLLLTEFLRWSMLYSTVEYCTVLSAALRLVNNHFIFFTSSWMKSIVKVTRSYGLTDHVIIQVEIGSCLCCKSLLFVNWDFQLVKYL